jgi:hypothetical protein
MDAKNEITPVAVTHSGSGTEQRQDLELELEFTDVGNALNHLNRFSFSYSSVLSQVCFSVTYMKNFKIKIVIHTRTVIFNFCKLSSCYISLYGDTESVNSKCSLLVLWL